MSNYVVCADLHLSKSNLHPAMRVLQQILDYSREHDAIILFLGDLFHDQGKVEGKIHFEVLWELFHLLECYDDVEIWIIPGNHDEIDQGKWSVDILNKLRNITIFYYFTEKLLGNGYYGTFIPWYLEADDFLAELKQSEHKHFLFCHVGILGAKHWNFLPQETVKATDFKGWKYVLSGHYHHPQKLTKRVEYVGSLLQNSWKDACVGKIKRRRFLHLSLEPKVSIKRIPIDEPVYLVCRSDEIRPNRIPDGSQVRVNVVDDDFNWEKLERKLEKRGIRIHFFFEEQGIRQKKRTKLHVGMKPEEVVESYLMEQLELFGFDPEELLEGIKDYLVRR